MNVGSTPTHHTKSQEKLKKVLDKLHKMWYNKGVKREDTPPGGRTPVKWKR